MLTIFSSTSSYPGKPTHRVNGFSLIEVLVALVVLSIGLLGMAGLYVTTLRAGNDSISRSSAVQLVNDMADRIRANPTARNTYAGAAATVPGCMNARCNATQIAQQDLFWWQNDITQFLPGATGTVAFNQATTPATYTIQLAWQDTDSSRQNFTLVTQVCTPQIDC